MNLENLGTAGLQGWRSTIGDAVARPVSRRTGLDAEQVRAAVGFVFFCLALAYVTRTVRDVVRSA